MPGFGFSRESNDQSENYMDFFIAKGLSLGSSFVFHVTYLKIYDI